MHARELANLICSELQSAGHQAFLVGGCVRDILLGRTPADNDVATSARPDQVLRLFPEGVTVGAQFGVIVVPRDGIKVEVATFRSDLGYSDGRRPDRVDFSTSPEQDVKRRDFTINGMLMRHDNGVVLDFVSGQADLRAGVIRAIGEPERRFAEDKLRMLRAVRFAARFGYEIEHQTFAAIRKQAKEVAIVSAERSRDELTKLLTEGAARAAFELLDQCWLLPMVLPEIARMKGVQQPPQYHPEGDVWTHTMLMLEGLSAGCAATLAWGVLLHDVGKPATFRSAKETGDRIRFDGHVEVGMAMATEILGRLKFSNQETDQILSLIEHHMRFKDVARMRAATLKRFVRLPMFEEHMALHRLDCLSSNRNLEAYQFVQDFLEATPPEEVRPAKLLTGTDVVQLGFPPGPVIGRILSRLEEAQLNGEISSPNEAVELIRSEFESEVKAQKGTP